MPLKVLLPGSLLLMAFLLKLFLDRKAEVPDIIRAVLELPVDVVFLSLSFVVGFILDNPSQATAAAFIAFCYVGAAIVIVLFWRRSERNFLSDRFWWTFVFAAANYVLCISALVFGVQLISGDITL
jgi:hypothetical protein